MTYQSLVQEALCECQKRFDQKWYKYYSSKQKSQDQPSFSNAYIVEIYQSANNNLNTEDFNIHNSRTFSGSGEGSYDSLNLIFHNNGKKGHIQRY